jgi:YgiT-type zinc finger domain-containing protein
MSTKAKPKKERCAVCGGGLRATTITHEERRGTDLYLFQNVPAQVCTACGEVWIEEATLQEIDRLIREGKPVRKVETPVYDLAGAGMR